MTDTPLEAVPDDLVRTAVLAAFNIPEDYARKHPGIVDSLIDTYGDQHRAALAAVLPLAQAKAWSRGYAASDYEAYHLGTHGRTDNPYREGAKGDGEG